MTEQILILLEQILVMFLLMAVGYAVFRAKILTNEGTRQLSNLLARVVAPAVLISSFQRDFTPALAKTLLITFVCAFLTFGFGIVIANLLYTPKKYENYGARRMCAVFSNNGFMALPLLQAMFGQMGVFLGSAHIIAGTVLSWTYGVRQLTSGKARIDLKKILLNPGMVALFLGVALFVSPVKLPGPAYQALSFVGSLNTPLAMIVLGCYLAQTDLAASLRSLDLWKTSLVRLLAIPLVCTVFLLFTPLDETARLILLIGYCTPVAVVAATFAQMFEGDYLYSTRAVALSTLLSAVTMPGMIALYSVLRALFPGSP